MDVAIADNPELRRFEIRVDGELAGFAEYRLQARLIAFIHTEVGEQYEGQGLAGRLVGAALDEARARDLEVLPFCPYVRSFIERHPEYGDLVPEAWRDSFADAP